MFEEGFVGGELQRQGGKVGKQLGGTVAGMFR
jgi:hypothetical protein